MVEVERFDQAGLRRGDAQTEPDEIDRILTLVVLRASEDPSGPVGRGAFSHVIPLRGVTAPVVGQSSPP